jgi:hypothetical protein
VGKEAAEGTGATETVDRLIEACPSFLGATALFEYVEWSEDEDRADPYVRAAAFSQHVVDRIAARDVDELPGVFATVEDLLDGGDRDTHDLVTMGFFEVLQNICSHDDVTVDVGSVELLLGPRAAEAWIELDQLWASAATRVPSEGPRVTEADYLGVTDPNLKVYLRTTRRKQLDGILLSGADVLRYEHWVADVTWRSPEARRRANRTALLVGLVLAVAVAIALLR